MNNALARNKLGVLTNEEVKEIKSLYRAIVKSLHPDIHPDISEAHIKLFQNAVVAYEAGNIKTLRIIKKMLAESSLVDLDNNELSTLTQEKERLSAMLELVKEQIIKIQKTYPYNLLEILNNEELIAEKKVEFEETISKLQETIEIYKKHIEELLR